jgi:hypothetical protein
LTGEPVSFEKPVNVAESFIDPYWRKYFSNIWLESWASYRVHFGRYLCREWNGEVLSAPAPKLGEEPHSKMVKQIDIYYMRRLTPAPHEAPQPIEKLLVWSHTCF